MKRARSRDGDATGVGVTEVGAGSRAPLPTARSRQTRPLLADVVRDGLRRAVITSEYLPGTRLPNEDDLALRFAVSRATIREAVRGLVEEGYLSRRQGSGTYATSRPLLRNSLDTNFSYTSYLESTGVRAGRRILSLRTIPATATIGDRLHLDPGRLVVEICRVRTADDRPAVYSMDYLRADIVNMDRDRVDLGGSLYALFAGLGHPIRHGEAIVAPASADAALADVLEVPPGTLLQHLQQVDVDAQGLRVMYSLEWHVPDIIELRVYRRGPGATEGGA